MSRTPCTRSGSMLCTSACSRRRVRALEEAERDLFGAETAERLEREHELRLGRYRGIGADEQQPQHVVLDLLLRVLGLHLREIALVSFLAAQLVEDVIVRHAIEPRSGVFGQLRGPRTGRMQERRLRGVLAELEAMDAEPPRENGDQTPELPAEPMGRKLGPRHLRTW